MTGQALPAGPGMRARWLLAAPLAASVVVLPAVVILLVLRPGSGAPPPRNVITAALATPWTYVVAAAVLLLVDRRRPRWWPLVSLVATVPLLPLAVLLGGRYSASGTAAVVRLAGPVLLLAGPVAVLVVLALTWLARDVLTTPLRADVAGSGLDVPVPTRDTRARLALSRTRLLLDRAGPYRLAIPLGSLEVVQAGRVAVPGRWELPHGGVAELSPGPVVRLVGNGQQWVVPVLDAESAVAAVERRRARWVASGGSGEPAPTPAEWEDQVQLLTREKWRDRVPVRYFGPLLRNLPLRGGVLAVAVAVVSACPFLVRDWSALNLLGTLCYGVPGVIGVVIGVRPLRARRLLSAWPRRPGSSWGPSDPAVAPVPGWAATRTVTLTPVPGRPSPTRRLLGRRRSPFDGLRQQPSPDAVVLSLRKEGAMVTAVLGVVGVVAGVAALGYLIDPATFSHNGQASLGGRIFAGFVAAVFLPIGGLGLLFSPLMLSGHNGIAVDARGVWRRAPRQDAVVVQWHDLAAVGVALVHTASQVAQVLELFPATEKLARHYRSRWPDGDADVEPPRPDLPRFRLRFQLPSFDEPGGDRIIAAVERCAPTLWLGRAYPATAETPRGRQATTS